MRFTATQIETIVSADVRDRQQRAKVEALKVLAERARRNGDGSSNSQAEAVVRLCERRLETPIDANAPTPYVSPLSTAQPRVTAKDGRPVPVTRSLSPVDLAWIDRLPTDAAKVTPDDVRALAQMRAECTGAEDQRLLATVLAPIERREEAREQAAQAEVEKYKARPVPGMRREAWGDIVEALRPIVAENAPPELTPRDIEHRASDAATDLVGAPS